MVGGTPMNADCRTVSACRVCGADGLETILDLGRQHLQGVFPAKGEPDPPAFPLVLGRCGACGLVQLGHTVRPQLLFGPHYGYRSGVTETMRHHLAALAVEAVSVLGREPASVLDIGCNDGTLLYEFRGASNRVGIDPSWDGPDDADTTVITGFYPTDLMRNVHFDLIFTIACFYDADGPVTFAKAVRDNLTPDGLWCVEVANLGDMLWNTGFDAVCFEHLVYYDWQSLGEVCGRAGLKVVHAGINVSNGGSLRVYACRQESRRVSVGLPGTPINRPDVLLQFAQNVARRRLDLQEYLQA